MTPDTLEQNDQYSSPEVEVIVDNGEFQVTATRLLTTDEIEAYYSMVSKGFEELNQNSLLKQDMTLEEFAADAKDPNVIKFKTLRKDASGEFTERAALGMGHAGIEGISWVNQQYLRKHAEARMATPKPEHTYYIGTIVVDRDLRGINAGLQMIRAFEEYFARDVAATGGNAIAYFDHANANAFLPSVIEQCFATVSQEGGYPDFEVKELGQHIWHSITPNRSLSYDDRLMPDIRNLSDEAIEESYEHYLAAIHPFEVVTPAPLAMPESTYTELAKNEDVKKFLNPEAPLLLFAQSNLPDFFSPDYIKAHFGGSKLIYIPFLELHYATAPAFVDKVITTLAQSYQEDGKEGIVIVSDSTDENSYSSFASNGKVAVHEKQKYCAIQLKHLTA